MVTNGQQAPWATTLPPWATTAARTLCCYCLIKCCSCAGQGYTGPDGTREKAEKGAIAKKKAPD